MSMWSRFALVFALVCWPVVAMAGDSARPVVRGGGHSLTVRAAHVYSLSNDNQKLRVFLEVPKIAGDAFPVLSLGRESWTAQSMGYDDHGSQVYFDLDRETGLRLARAFGVVAHDRVPLDGGIRYTWTFPPTATVGGPVTVGLRIENAGTTVVGLAVGGRQRGPRDNRFSFEVTRDGKPLPILDAPDFGGVMTYQKLAPGDHFDTSVDLRSWAKLDQPGHYAVVAHHDDQLTKDGTMPSNPDDLANVWDLAPVGQGSFVIR